MHWTALMARLATLTGLEVILTCHAGVRPCGADRRIAHVGAPVFAKGATPGEALEALVGELIGQEWPKPEEPSLLTKSTGR